MPCMCLVDLRCSRTVSSTNGSMTARSLRERVSGPLVAGLGVLLATLVRQEGVPVTDSIWAEDGALFLNDAQNGAGSLFKPYSGYLHIVPRLLALMVAQLPVEFAATAIAILSGATVGILAAYVCRALSTHLGTRRATIAALTFGLHPWLGPEVLATFANLHWFMVMTTAVPVLLPEIRRDLPRSSSLITLLTLLTAGVAIMLVPLLLLPRIRKEVQGRPDTIELLLVIGSTALIGVLLVSPDTSAPSGLFFEPLRIGRLLAIRGIGGIVFGRELLRQATEADVQWPAVGAFALATIYLIRRTDQPHRRISTRLLSGAVAISGGIFLVRGPNVRTILDWTAGFTPDSGSRYVVIPAVLGSIAVIVLLASPSYRWRDPIRLSVTAVLLIAFTVDFQASSQRSVPPGWRDSVIAACRAEETRVLTPPRSSSRDWIVELPSDAC